MPTYFVGSEFDSVDASTAAWASSHVAETTTDGVSGFTRGSINIYATDSYKRISCGLIDPATGLRAPATGTIWFHFSCRYGSAMNTGVATIIPVMIYNSSETPIVRQANTNTSNTYQWQYWNGTAWVNLPTTSLWSSGQINNIDIKLTIGASGAVEVYINQMLDCSVTGIDTSNMINVKRIDFGSNRTDGWTYYQQMLVASYSTIGHTVRRRTPTGNGTNVAWSGDYTGVDEYSTNDGDGVFVGAAGASETFTAAALSATESGKVIKAVAVVTRARADADSATKSVRGVVRVGTTDYASPPMQGTLDVGFSPRMAIWDKDPSTNADWINVGAVNGEFGIKSDT